MEKYLKVLETHLLSNIQWDIFVFDHVHNLTLHREDKQNDPVTQ